MTTDDLPLRSAHFWRDVLHDVLDEVFDRMLDEDGDPGDDPSGDPPPEDVLLREGLAWAIVRATAGAGCDGTLRCTLRYVVGQGIPADLVADRYRRAGIRCDCAVLHTVLGRTDVRPRCALRPDEP